MYILDLWKKLPLTSALRFRNATIHPDNQIMKIRARGHSSVYIRRSPADLDTFSEVFFSAGVYGDALSRITDCKYFVDLGANIGLASVFVKEHFPQVQIFAFEPHGENFKLLRMNAPFAQCHQAAAWGEEGSVSLEGAPDQFNAFRTLPGTTTPAFSMEHILSLPNAETDFLKIDIEGAEVELFKDPSWLRHVKMLAIEFHGDSRSQCRFDQAIAAHGLKVMSESKHTTVAGRST